MSSTEIGLSIAFLTLVVGIIALVANRPTINLTQNFHRDVYGPVNNSLNQPAASPTTEQPQSRQTLPGHPPDGS